MSIEDDFFEWMGDSEADTSDHQENFTEKKPEETQYVPEELTMSSMETEASAHERLERVRAEWNTEKQRTIMFPYTVRDDIDTDEFDYRASPVFEQGQKRKVPIGKWLLILFVGYLVALGMIYAGKAFF